MPKLNYAARTHTHTHTHTQSNITAISNKSIIHKNPEHTAAETRLNTIH